MRSVTADRWGLLSSGSAPCRALSPRTTPYRTPENPQGEVASSETGDEPCVPRGAPLGSLPMNWCAVPDLSWPQQDLGTQGRQEGLGGEADSSKLCLAHCLLLGGSQKMGGEGGCHASPQFCKPGSSLLILSEKSFTASLSCPSSPTPPFPEPPRGPVCPIPDHSPLVPDRTRVGHVWARQPTRGCVKRPPGDVSRTLPPRMREAPRNHAGLRRVMYFIKVLIRPGGFLPPRADPGFWIFQTPCREQRGAASPV